MARKIVAGGYLYLAPDNLDFTISAHKTKVIRILFLLCTNLQYVLIRFQVLGYFSDGSADGLHYSMMPNWSAAWMQMYAMIFALLESHYFRFLQPETVPQMTVDMNRCVHVEDADEVTGSAHSIAVTLSSEAAQPQQYYLKADTADDIRR